MAEIFHGEGNGGRTGRVIARRPLSGEYLSGGRRTDRWCMAGESQGGPQQSLWTLAASLAATSKAMTSGHAHTTAQGRVYLCATARAEIPAVTAAGRHPSWASASASASILAYAVPRTRALGTAPLLARTFSAVLDLLIDQPLSGCGAPLPIEEPELTLQSPTPSLVSMACL
jgi:hypothetical protein